MPLNFELSTYSDANPPHTTAHTNSDVWLVLGWLAMRIVKKKRTASPVKRKKTQLQIISNAFLKNSLSPCLFFFLLPLTHSPVRIRCRPRQENSRYIPRVLDKISKSRISNAKYRKDKISKDRISKWHNIERQNIEC